MLRTREFNLQPLAHRLGAACLLKPGLRRMIGFETAAAQSATASAFFTASRGSRSLPTDFAGFRDLVARRKSCLPRQLRLAAEYLVSHPDEVAFDPLVTIGKRAGVSPSCIVRLSQRLGFEGFSQLQRLFRKRLAPIEAVALVRDPLRDVIQTAECALRRLDCEINRVLLERAINAMAAARTVFLIGHGLSAGLALFAAQSFQALGQRTVVLGNPGAGTELANDATATDACLVFDLDSAGEPYAAAVKRLQNKRIPTILFASRPMRDRSDHGVIGFEVGDGSAEMSSAIAGATCLMLAIVGTIRERRFNA